LLFGRHNAAGDPPDPGRTWVCILHRVYPPVESRSTAVAPKPTN